MSAIGDVLPYAGSFPAPDYVQYGDGQRMAYRFAPQIDAAGIVPMTVSAVITKGPVWAVQEVWVAWGPIDANPDFKRVV